jgi:hypothetical protein
MAKWRYYGPKVWETGPQDWMVRATNLDRETVLTSGEWAVREVLGGYLVGGFLSSSGALCPHAERVPWVCSEDKKGKRYYLREDDEWVRRGEEEFEPVWRWPVVVMPLKEWREDGSKRVQYAPIGVCLFCAIETAAKVGLLNPRSERAESPKQRSA